MNETIKNLAADITKKGVLGGPGTRPMTVEPLPVVKDIVELAGRLTAEHQRVKSGENSCCVALCHPDLVSGWPIEELVANIAERFSHKLRSYDSIFLYGRDKILLCLPHVKTVDVRTLLGRLRDIATERAIPMPTGTLTLVSVSVGGVMMDPRTQVQETIDRADRAMDMARVAGGNRVCLWSPDMM